MKIDRGRFRFAAGFFFIWLSILFAGADFPPPIGFLWIVLLDLIAAVLVYLRIPTYLRWKEQKKKARIVSVGLDGFIVGFLFALSMFLFPGEGEPLQNLRAIDLFIWFAVAGFVGVFNSLIIYFLSTRIFSQKK